MVMTNAFWIWIILLAVLVSSQAKGQQKVIAEGAWSKPVVDTRGFAVRGRLLLCEKQRSDDRREVAVYVELQDANESVGSSVRIFCDFGKTDFRPENKGGLHCELFDKDKAPVPTTSYPFGGGTPASEWVTLPPDSTIRLRTSPFGIHQTKAMAISPQLGQLWVIKGDDRNEYFMSGTFTADLDPEKESIEDPHIWRGTIVLPCVRIVNQRR
jgi:hypothetical protein